MKIAIVGYGKMGRMIERLGIARGHDCAARFDIDNNAGAAGLTVESLTGVDVGIEFSTPQTAVDNIRRLAACKIPIVVGTTGWYERLDEVKSYIAEQRGAL